MYNYRRSCSEYSLYQRVIIILIQINLCKYGTYN